MRPAQTTYSRACPRCTEIERQREMAESPSWRVLCALKRQSDWVTVVDLADAAEDAPKRVAWSLRYWLRRGEVETTGVGSGMRYRARRAA